MEDLASWSISGGRAPATCFIPCGPVAASAAESWMKTWGSSVFGCLDSAEKNAACVMKSICRGDAAKPPPNEAKNKPAAAERTASGLRLCDLIMSPFVQRNCVNNRAGRGPTEERPKESADFASRFAKLGAPSFCCFAATDAEVTHP